MARIAHLRPPALTRSPEREALASAIGRHGEAVAWLDRLRLARQRADTKATDAAIRATEAEAALAAAREVEARDGDRRRLAALLGEAPADGKSAVEMAAATLEQAEAARRDTFRDIDLIGAEIRKAEQRQRSSQDAVAAAVGAALAADPVVAGLAEQITAARRRLGDLAAIARALPGCGALADGLPALPVDEAMLAPWRAAAAMLATDPDAPLPAVPVEVEWSIIDPAPAA